MRSSWRPDEALFTEWSGKVPPTHGGSRDLHAMVVVTGGRCAVLEGRGIVRDAGEEGADRPLDRFAGHRLVSEHQPVEDQRAE